MQFAFLLLKYYYSYQVNEIICIEALLCIKFGYITKNSLLHSSMIILFLFWGYWMNDKYECKHLAWTRLSVHYKLQNMLGAVNCSGLLRHTWTSPVYIPFSSLHPLIWLSCHGTHTTTGQLIYSKKHYNLLFSLNWSFTSLYRLYLVDS